MMTCAVTGGMLGSGLLHVMLSVAENVDPLNGVNEVAWLHPATGARPESAPVTAAAKLWASVYCTNCGGTLVQPVTDVHTRPSSR